VEIFYKLESTELLEKRKAAELGYLAMGLLPEDQPEGTIGVSLTSGRLTRRQCRTS
jgi:hypothetical protein